MALGTAAMIGIGVGGLAGALGSNSSQNTQSGLHLKNASGLEQDATQGMTQDYGALRGMIDAGPGQNDVVNGVNAQRSFADMLKQYSQGGYNPTDDDINSSNNLAEKLFGAQRVGLQQSFDDQNTAFSRQAAMMGRSQTDPILQAKLRTEQMRQSSVINANQSGFAAQQAMNQPLQRLGFAGQRAGALQGLASQAMANRQALLSMGSGIQNSERNFRLQTATKFSNQDTQSGGGLAGGIMGGLAGAGAFANAFGGGSGGGYNPGGGTGAVSGFNYSQSPQNFFGLASANMPGQGGGYSQPNLQFSRPSPMDPGWGTGR